MTLTLKVHVKKFNKIKADMKTFFQFLSEWILLIFISTPFDPKSTCSESWRHKIFQRNSDWVSYANALWAASWLAERIFWKPEVLWLKNLYKYRTRKKFLLNLVPEGERISKNFRKIKIMFWIRENWFFIVIFAIFSEFHINI